MLPKAIKLFVQGPMKRFAERSMEPLEKYDELLTLTKKRKLRFGHISRRSSDLAKTILKDRKKR